MDSVHAGGYQQGYRVGSLCATYTDSASGFLQTSHLWKRACRLLAFPFRPITVGFRITTSCFGQCVMPGTRLRFVADGDNVLLLGNAVRTSLEGLMTVVGWLGTPFCSSNRFLCHP